MKPLSPSKIQEAKPKFSDPVSQCLWDAADMIESRGWYHPDNWFKRAKHICAMLAITECNELEIRAAAMKRFAAFINEERDPYFYIPAWNDHPSRTKQEVITALRSCALQSESSNVR